MALQTRLVQKLSQSMMMTPQLQQAIKLLQLGRMDFIEAIQQELIENPLLEEDSEGGSFEGGSTDNGAGLVESEMSELSQHHEQLAGDSWTSVGAGSFEEGDQLWSVESYPAPKESLQDFLQSQVRQLELEPDEMVISLYLIGNLDFRGFLTIPDQSVAEALGVTEEVISNTVTFLQEQLEPEGILARNLVESLQIQLKRRGLEQSLVYRIACNHLQLLSDFKLEVIAKLEQTTLADVQSAAAKLRELTPYPARVFNDEEIRYVIPDVYVHRIGSEYVVSLNEDGMPKLRVSDRYQELIGSAKSKDSTNTKVFVNDRVKAANWFIRSIEQRKQTILRVTEKIVELQRGFFDHGISKLKPLVLREVADALALHESTVSRVTTAKFVHTPRGVFELKFFFTTGLKAAGGDVSAEVVKDQVRSLIAAEPPESPLSDQEIVELLKKQRIDVARRTVAKYRELLNIPSASKRKRRF